MSNERIIHIEIEVGNLVGRKAAEFLEETKAAMLEYLPPNNTYIFTQMRNGVSTTRISTM